MEQRARRALALMSAETVNVAVVWFGTEQGASFQDVYWPFVISWAGTVVLAFVSGYQPIGKKDREKCAIAFIVLFSIYSVWVLPILLVVGSHLFNFAGTTNEPLAPWVAGILISGIVAVIGLMLIGILGCWARTFRDAHWPAG